MNPIVNYPNYNEVFVKIEKTINKKELYTIFPNAVLSFATQLSRGNIIAITFYNSFNR
jgi:hypothetical protein